MAGGGGGVRGGQVVWWGSHPYNSSKPNYLPKAPHPNTMALEVRTLIYEPGGGREINSVQSKGMKRQHRLWTWFQPFPGSWSISYFQSFLPTAPLPFFSSRAKSTFLGPDLSFFKIIYWTSSFNHPTEDKRQTRKTKKCPSPALVFSLVKCIWGQIAHFKKNNNISLYEENIKTGISELYKEIYTLLMSFCSITQLLSLSSIINYRHIGDSKKKCWFTVLSLPLHYILLHSFRLLCQSGSLEILSVELKTW